MIIAAVSETQKALENARRSLIEARAQLEAAVERPDPKIKDSVDDLSLMADEAFDLSDRLNSIISNSWPQT